MIETAAPTAFQRFLSIAKDIAQIGQSLVIIAVAIGGGFLYLRRRQRFPRAKMTHEIRHKRITENQIVLLLVVTIVNIGEVIIRLKKGEAWIRQLKPAEEFLKDKSGEELQECTIGYLIAEKKADCTDVEIEPNEEQEFCFEFLLAHDVEALSIYSHFENERKSKKQIGWNKMSWYDVT